MFQVREMFRAEAYARAFQIEICSVECLPLGTFTWSETNDANEKIETTEKINRCP